MSLYGLKFCDNVVRIALKDGKRYKLIDYLYIIGRSQDTLFTLSRKTQKFMCDSLTVIKLHAFTLSIRFRNVNHFQRDSSLLVLRFYPDAVTRSQLEMGLSNTNANIHICYNVVRDAIKSPVSFFDKLANQRSILEKRYFSTF